LKATRQLSTWRAFGLAFAIALAPSLLQVEDPCTLEHSHGDARLAVLAIEVDGEDMIAFTTDPDQVTYKVMLPESHEAIVVRAESMDPAAQVTYNLNDGCPPPIEFGDIGTGGGEVELETMPDGHTILEVWVHAPEGKSKEYTVFFTQPHLCT